MDSRIAPRVLHLDDTEDPGRALAPEGDLETSAKSTLQLVGLLRHRS